MGNTTSSGQSTQKQDATANSSEPASGVGKKDNSSSQAPTSSASQSNQTSQSSSTATSSSSSSKSDNQTQPSSDPTASSSLEPMTTVLSGGLYKTYDDAVAAIKVQGKSVDDMTVKSVTMSDGSYQWTWGPTGDSGSSSNKTKLFLKHQQLCTDHRF